MAQNNFDLELNSKFSDGECQLTHTQKQILEKVKNLDNKDEAFITQLLTMMQKDFDFDFYKWLRKQGLKKLIFVPQLMTKYNIDIKHQEYPFILDEEFIPEELLYLDSISSCVPNFRIRVLISMPKKPNNRSLKHLKRMIGHIKPYEIFRIDMNVHPDFVNQVEWKLQANHIRFQPLKHCPFNFAFMYSLKSLFSVEIAQTQIDWKNFTFIMKCLNIRILTFIDCDFKNLKYYIELNKVHLFCLSSQQLFSNTNAEDMLSVFLKTLPKLTHLFICGGSNNQIPFDILIPQDWISCKNIESLYFESEEILDPIIFKELFSLVAFKELKIQMGVAESFPDMSRSLFPALQKCSLIFEIDTIHQKNDIQTFLSQISEYDSMFIEFGIKLGVILMTKDFESILSCQDYDLVPVNDHLYLNLLKTGEKHLLSQETFAYVDAICDYFDIDLPQCIKIIK
eukprot:NODE_306_length_10184_cov_0.912246.p2 type:complete len:453 gc:universal NODE_306_length_10184_cov_0.912246:8782-7424(-)